MSNVTGAPVKRPRRSPRRKLATALRGIKLGVRGHSSFFVHFFFAALVLAGAIVLECGSVQWCVLIGCIGMVLTAELFHSAIERLFAGLDEAAKQRVWPALDVAAGAVLMATVTAGVIWSITFAAAVIEMQLRAMARG
jgi:diacylglycerol kinase